jgi:hypothetical protein
MKRKLESLTAGKTERNTKDKLGKLPATLVGKILYEFAADAPVMPLKQMVELSQVSKSNYALFQPVLNEAKAANPLLLSVVQGNVEALKRQVIDHPDSFFRKGQITDLAKTTFYNVSPYQLMIFLCDDDMRDQIIPLIPKMIPYQRANKVVMLDTMAIRERQYAEIDSGGADFVKMDRDPTQLEFAEITHFKTNYTLNGVATAVTFSLLGNPDGIIYYQDPITKLEHLYYANQKTQTVELLTPEAHSEQEHQGLDKLYASFAAMENNSSQRSSNEERTLIARTTQHQLSRKGIQYEHKGILYCDYRMEFRLLNAYRKSIRLSQEPQWDVANAYWCSGVGDAQRQVSWVLQRICEPGRPFYPMPDFKASPFQRGFKIYDSRTGHEKSICSAGAAADAGLGRNFGIFKADLGCASAVGYGGATRVMCVDLLATNRLVEDAKASVVEFTPDRELLAEDAASTLRCGPGC